MDATVDKRLTELYPAHFAAIAERFCAALADTGYDAIVIGAGVEIMRFLDDQPHPFIANPHLVQWLPLNAHPESALIYRPETRPRLIVYQPDDYWYQPPTLPGEPWARHFDIVPAGKLDAVHAELNELPERTAFIGDPAQWRHETTDKRNNPDELLKYLHYFRPFKTDYEIECIRQATRLAVPAHRAARAAFESGASEYDIWLAFLGACRQTETELPYPAIIAKNRNGAVLHYQHYQRDTGATNSLLIDAACSAFGYASDITRTYSPDAEFAAMITDLDRAQQDIAAAVEPGKPFVEMHDRAHRSIAHLLSDWQLVDGDPDSFIERGITAAFLPHGLGHFLGLQVHEVGGSYADTAGNELARPEKYPKLRLVRTLEPGQVLTIEPGIYFIDSLLNKLRSEPAGKDVNWDKLERLHKFGGIRIEDNVVVTKAGGLNMTRAAFAE